MIQIARLDKNGFLIGYTRVKRVAEKHVVVPEGCDLPTDGSYRWTGKTFIPRGHGYGKPARPPVASDYAMFLMMKALLAGTDLPAECQAYVTWYEQNLAKRNEELAK
jgi:hypothetical protein